METKDKNKDKKKILLISDSPTSKTGFGRAAKSVMTYLYKTNKYNIVQFCCGTNWSNPDFKRVPWPCYGTLPDLQVEYNEIANDPNQLKLANYGDHFINRIVEQEKPDVIIIMCDIWGGDYLRNKLFYPHVNVIFWVTIDSVPILPMALEQAKSVKENPDTKKYWTWAKFAEKEMHRLGFENVKNVFGTIDTAPFKPLDKIQKIQLRIANNIPQDAFIVGFVFRNQLRKLVPNLLEGYALWKKRYPEVKNPRLLLHTHFSEDPGRSWDIPRLVKENGIPNEEVLTTYICKECHTYEIRPFTGQDLGCKYCKAEKSQITCNTKLGVDEEQLCEVINLMDVAIHPATSAGLEIPLLEYQLCGVPTAVSDYSAGEDMYRQNFPAMALGARSVYREIGTQFYKHSADPNDIAKCIQKIYSMAPEKRLEMGLKARQYILENYSVNVIGPKVEKELEDFEKVDYSKFSLVAEKKDPDAKLEPKRYNKDFVLQLYDKILKSPTDMNDEGAKHWLKKLADQMPREQVEKYFRDVARQDNVKLNPNPVEEYLSEDDAGNRILFVIPKSLGDCFICSSLFKSLKEKFPNHNLYVATEPQNFEIFEGNKYAFRVIPYFSCMDSLLWAEGQGNHTGLFEYSFLPYLSTQRQYMYHHNQLEDLPINVNYGEG